MPTYEYECKSCGHGFEAFQAMSDSPLKDCPECGNDIRRLINGGTGVIFKGSGFYVTDKSKTGKKEAQDSPQKPGDKTACSECAASKQCPASKANNEKTGEAKLP